MQEHVSATACTGPAIPPCLHRAVAGRTHPTPGAEAGSHRLAAAVEAGSHPKVAADSFREAVDSSLSSFSLLQKPIDLRGERCDLAAAELAVRVDQEQRRHR